MSIQIQISQTDEVLRRVEATVDAKVVRKAVDRAFRDLGRQVRIPGFRPGKVPRSILEKRFGSAVFNDVADDLIQRAFEQAVAEHELFPVHLQVSDRTPITYGQDYRFEFDVEVKPTAALTRVDGLAVERPIVEVEESEIEHELDTMCRRASRVEASDNKGPIESGKGVLVDLDMVLHSEGMEPLENKNYLLSMDNDPFHGFATGALEGHSVGDEFEAEVTVGERFWRREWAGRTCRAEFRIHSLKTMTVPAKDDEFAKDSGFEDLAALRKDLESQIRTHKGKAAQDMADRSLVDALVEANPFPIGPGLIARQADSMLESMRRQYASQGMELPHLHLHDLQEEERKSILESAEKDLRRALLLEQVAREKSLEVTDEQVDARVSEMAEEMGLPAEKVKGMLQRSEALGGLKIELRERAALDSLLAQAKLTEVPWPQPDSPADADSEHEDEGSEAAEADGAEK